MFLVHQPRRNRFHTNKKPTLGAELREERSGWNRVDAAPPGWHIF